MNAPRPRLSDHPTFDPNVPFNNLPKLPPANEVETRAVLKATIAAREKLAELRTACQLIPNPDIITSTIPLREARASSEIENIVTTNDELFRAAHHIDAEPTAATKEALRYSFALREGVRSLKDRPLSVKTAIAVCGTLQGNEAQIRSTPGTYIGNPHTGERRYTPPEGFDTIMGHLSTWENYMHSDHDVDDLVKMALLHYQFEAIHPFYDGNGRTGRIINILYLLQQSLLELPVLYLSGYIVENKSEYYRLLNAVTASDAWEEWLLFMIRGVEVSSMAASSLIADLRAVQETMVHDIRAAGVISPAMEIAELALIKPYLRIRDVEGTGLVKRQTASAWLNHLVSIGLLESHAVGREKIFINHRALEVLTR
ncbi:Fic family protein [uncultured Corynebacterium sp.]|uniref:Fic family protein n=1 Tax=uncultured Corynebacterium sp. TaxID=159447 RepID=UPI0025E82820|nr:Fic family protein [uncultured Corynebacterium sp.]